MGLFHRGKKNNDDEPDSVQTFFINRLKKPYKASARRNGRSGDVRETA